MKDYIQADKQVVFATCLFVLFLVGVVVETTLSAPTILQVIFPRSCYDHLRQVTHFASDVWSSYIDMRFRKNVCSTLYQGYCHCDC